MIPWGNQTRDSLPPRVVKGLRGPLRMSTTDAVAAYGRIVRRLVEARRASKLSQLHLAERLNVADNTIGNWERVDLVRGPSVLTLLRWANALGYEVCIRRKSA